MLRVALDELPAVKVWGLRAAGLIGRGHGASRSKLAALS